MIPLQSLYNKFSYSLLTPSIISTLPALVGATVDTKILHDFKDLIRWSYAILSLNSKP